MAPVKPPTKTEAPKSSAPKKSEHPAAQGISQTVDQSALDHQEQQDELQQPGRVSKAVADQVDNDPGYSKDQLAHMEEYWSHDGPVTPEEE